MKSVNNEELQYIPMTIGYYDEACRLWEKTEGVGLTIGDSKDSLKRYLERNPEMSFVCIQKETGRIIGTVLGGHDGRRGFIYHLAVDNDFRKRSIGKNLLEYSITALKAAGIERGMIMVKADNEEGAAFWEKLGWFKRDLIMYSINFKSDSPSK